MGQDTDLSAVRREFELLGARARLETLDAERDKILAMYPELGPRKYKPRAVAPDVVYDAGDLPANARHIPDRKRPYHPRRQFPPEYKARIVARIKKGEYVPDLSRELNIGEVQLRQWATSMGVKIPPMPMAERVKRNQAARTSNEDGKRVGAYGKGPYSEEFRARAVERSKTEPIREIAKALGISEAVIHKWRSRVGVSHTPTAKIYRDKKAANRANASNGAKGREANIKSAFENFQRPTMMFLAGRDDGTANRAELQTEFKCSDAAAGHRVKALVKRGWATLVGKATYQITDKGRERLEQAE